MTQEPAQPGRRAVIAAAAAALGTAGVAACSTSAQPTTASVSTPGPTGPRAKAAPGQSPDLPTGTTPGSGPAGSGPAGSGGSIQAGSKLLSTGPDIRTGPADPARVALTFHGAGPAALTLSVLDIARAHDARVTVFAVGTWLQANPRLGRAILAGGHDLGNHTYSHRPMLRLTPAEAEAEVSRGAAAVAAVRGTAGLLFRPSGTPLSNQTIREAALASGYHRCISYDVDPLDYLDPGTAAVRDRTLAGVRPGSIVSLHLGHAGTVAALPGILDGLHQRGLSAVTVTELLNGAA